ncbi:MAG: DUF4349 domain-containing protein [Gemmataceae bacterium]|nr:DUF4349 domain-containing protein [Gemmataceae bacterium]
MAPPVNAAGVEAQKRVLQSKSDDEPISQEDGQLLEGQKAEKQGGQPKPQPKVARKIKHTADLTLITDEFDKKRDELQQLIVKHDGYEAMADVRSSPGSPRVGTWRVRAPIEHFSAFRDAVRKLAEVETDTVNTEDLTDQYYDLEANIKNLKAEQESWREMLKKTTDKLENLIAVKRELDRVTDEIQRKEGRLRLMANLTDLTTVNLTLRERQKFAPDKGPDVVEAATFGMRAEKTFEDSWAALRDFGQGLALVGIALAPWLPVLIVVGVPVWYWWRQWRKHVRTAAAVPVTPATPG